MIKLNVEPIYTLECPRCGEPHFGFTQMCIGQYQGFDTHVIFSKNGIPLCRRCSNELAKCLVSTIPALKWEAIE